MIKYIKAWLPARDEVGTPGRAARRFLGMMRREYHGEPLLEAHISADPIEQFSTWFDQAIKQVKDDPNAMLISTVGSDGQPSSRTVLLKEFDENGFVFYTNYQSRKARQISENPKVSITFYWPEMLRQVHIEGIAEKVPESQSDEYFATRPPASRLGAWASAQSRTLNSREELEKIFEDIKNRFNKQDIPRPPEWGGFNVSPYRMEFWQGRLNRLHDRICYSKNDSKWHITRLSP